MWWAQRRVGEAARKVALGLALVSALLLHAGCGGPEPDGETGAETRAQEALSLAGRYRISVRPARPEPPLATMHDWIVRIERADGTAPGTLRVDFDGGMPSHGHGFVTAPRVTRALGDHEFLVEGVKFHMPGAWQLRVSVVDPEGSDGAAFDVEIDP